MSETKLKVTKQEVVMCSKGPCCFVRFEGNGTSDRAFLKESDADDLVAAWNTCAPYPEVEALAKALEACIASLCAIPVDHSQAWASEECEKGRVRVDAARGALAQYREAAK